MSAFRNPKGGRNVKKGIDTEQARSKRVEVSVQLRRTKREENVNSKRRVDVLSPAPSVKGQSDEIQQKLRNLQELVVGVASDDPVRQV